jgi:hypothetical protein
MWINVFVTCELCGAPIQGGRYCPWPLPCQQQAEEAERALRQARERLREAIR